jgi:selenophosphate synthetase-related protein
MYPAQVAWFLSRLLLKLSGEDLAPLAEQSHYSSRAIHDLGEASGDASRGGLLSSLSIYLNASMAVGCVDWTDP